MNNDEKFRTLLSDLGRATLRGVKKCPKCGTYNGSRGICCKNKYCDAVFKEPSEKRKLSAEACKLITGSTARIFSVRVRDKGPDYRGFVQLPINLNAMSDVGNLMVQSAALCFVDNCERSFNNSVLQCHEKDLAEEALTCQHVQAALNCYAEAQPLTLRNCILSSLNVNSGTKQEIWLLATETVGPLVQRVSKNIMAVKCKASPKHPLGYLHFSIFTTKLKDRTEHKFFCSCSPFKMPYSVDEDKTDETTAKKCIHFYACICAFASDPKLTEEFQYFINLDQPDLIRQESIDFDFNSSEADKLVELDLDNLSDDTHLLIFRDDSLTIQNLQNERLDIDSISIDPSLLNCNIVDGMRNQDHDLLDAVDTISQVHNLEVIDQNAVFDGSTIEIIRDPIYLNSNVNSSLNSHSLNEHIQSINGATVRILDNNLILNSDGFTFLEPNNTPTIESNMNGNESILKLPMDKKTSIAVKRKREENRSVFSNGSSNSVDARKAKTKTSNIVKKYSDECDNIDESTTSLSFIRWLSSITERINQTMHFQFDGKPEPLIFQVPHVFFECLRERISCGAKKKRLPNSTTAFVRKDEVPLGTFTKYTWHITNILHLKSIFETPMVPLEITRSFIQNPDGTYELYKREETEMDKFKKTINNPLIKPMELKTFLKVGNTSPNQIQPTPFMIEWIPDILPISKIGELRIRFEFGHVNNESTDKLKK